MTKMPEPFGYVVDHVCDDIRFSKEKPSQPRDALAEVEVEITPVITATQAEAYANERVKDAVKQIITLVEESIFESCDDDYEDGYASCAASLCGDIRALFPKEQL